MAKNISLLGADYPDVPAVVLPKTGGGSATFVDEDNYVTTSENITGSNSWTFNRKVYKYGNVVSFLGQASNTTAITTNSWVNIGTLPEGYRPPNDGWVCGYDNTNDALVEVLVASDGTISVYSKTASKAIRFNVTFII